MGLFIVHDLNKVDYYVTVYWQWMLMKDQICKSYIFSPKIIKISTLWKEKNQSLNTFMMADGNKQKHDQNWLIN
jgi:hypothetical protein